MKIMKLLKKMKDNKCLFILEKYRYQNEDISRIHKDCWVNYGTKSKKGFRIFKR